MDKRRITNKYLLQLLRENVNLSIWNCCWWSKYEYKKSYTTVCWSVIRNRRKLVHTFFFFIPTIIHLDRYNVPFNFPQHSTQSSLGIRSFCPFSYDSLVMVKTLHRVMPYWIMLVPKCTVLTPHQSRTVQFINLLTYPCYRFIKIYWTALS